MNKNPSFKHEKFYWSKGFQNVVGIDEVGRGAFAGPLIAAAVILPKNFKAIGIKDSKLLRPKKRELLSKYIIKNAKSYVISEITVGYVNKHGISKANHKAFVDCLSKIKFDFVLVDGFKIQDFDNKLQKSIIHGDNISVSIAAASIIAKVYRDNLMRTLDKQYPGYNFLKNKGYGTKFHREALKKYGLTKIHRTSFNLNKYL